MTNETMFLLKVGFLFIGVWFTIINVTKICLKKTNYLGRTCFFKPLA